MQPRFVFKPMKQSTGYAPLAVLGYYWQQQGCFTPLEQVCPPLKTVRHTPPEKLLDVIVYILAGYAALSTGSAHLRADLALAQAWGRQQFADHSGLSRTLAALGPAEVCTLRRAVTSIYHRLGHAHRHSLATTPLWLDLDLSLLPAGCQAEASRKGYGSGKKTSAAANWCG